MGRGGQCARRARLRAAHGQVGAQPVPAAVRERARARQGVEEHVQGVRAVQEGAFLPPTVGPTGQAQCTRHDEHLATLSPVGAACAVYWQLKSVKTN